MTDWHQAALVATSAVDDDDTIRAALNNPDTGEFAYLRLRKDNALELLRSLAKACAQFNG
jgi:hypothetical protein